MTHITSNQYSTLFVLSVTAATVSHVIGVGLLFVFAIGFGSFGVGLLAILLLNKRTLDPGE